MPTKNTPFSVVLSVLKRLELEGVFLTDHVGKVSPTRWTWGCGTPNCILQAWVDDLGIDRQTLTRVLAESKKRNLISIKTLKINPLPGEPLYLSMAERRVMAVFTKHNAGAMEVSVSPIKPENDPGLRARGESGCWIEIVVGTPDPKQWLETRTWPSWTADGNYQVVCIEEKGLDYLDAHPFTPQTVLRSRPGRPAVDEGIHKRILRAWGDGSIHSTYAECATQLGGGAKAIDVQRAVNREAQRRRSKRLSSTPD